jgi:DNA (cytosine-5)-methyltransferase 1
MLDLGLQSALEYHGIGTRVVGYCERESGAANILLARMEEQSLEQAPVWAGNLEDLRPEQFRGLVDWVVGGIPCQPFSTAGKRQGLSDDRWLWPAFWQFTVSVGAKFIAIENVAGFARKGLQSVLNDLAEAGWAAEWCHLRASAVGAAHQRDRFFLMAHAPLGEDGLGEFFGLERMAQERPPSVNAVGAEIGVMGDAASGEVNCGEPAGVGDTAGGGRGGHPAADDAGGALADAESQRERKSHSQPQPLAREGARETIGSGGGAMAHTKGLGRQSQAKSQQFKPQLPVPVRCGGNEVSDADTLREPQPEGRVPDSGGRTGNLGEELADATGLGRRVEGDIDKHSAPVATRGLPFFAPGPNSGAWGDILRPDWHLAPALEPGVCVLVDGLAVALDASRAEQLRAAGNGVVALQAAVAYGVLFERLLGGKGGV